MKTVNIHEAKTHLSRLVEEAVGGEPFIIAKSGRKLVQVTAIREYPLPVRIGFLKGRIKVPRNFDRMAETEIAALFGTDKHRLD